MKVELTLTGIAKVVALAITLISLLLSAGAFIHASQETKRETESLRVEFNSFKTDMYNVRIEMMKLKNELELSRLRNVNKLKFGN